MSEYHINLNIYHGPMDLLLYLVRKEEVDIHAVPISKITQQYIKHVELLQELDPDISGEFLVMASTLIEIKTRAMLPSPIEEEGSDEDLADPRIDLVRQLLQYKQFKDAAQDLEALAEERSLQFHRQSYDIGREDDEIELEDLHVWDLFEAFSSIMDAVGKLPVCKQIAYDETPQEIHQAEILDRVEKMGTVTFISLFEGIDNRTELCGIFLAVLELVRTKKISVKTIGKGPDLQIEARPAQEK